MSKKTAIDCLKVMKENGILRGRKLGIVTRDFPGDFPRHRAGEYLIFKDDRDGTVTTEAPLIMSEIEKNRAKGSLITTSGSIINVPKGYIKQAETREGDGE